MPRYHISPRTGNPVACKAKYRCPFGDLTKDHYPTPAAAQAAYELKMQDATLPSFAAGHLRASKLPSDMQLDDRTVLVPKGMYVVGDFSKNASSVDPEAVEAWRKTIEADPRAERKSVSGACLNGYPVIALKTKYGNGVYFDNSGRDYSVEGSTLGLTPLSLLKKMGLTEEEINESQSTIISLTEPTKISYDDGTLSFGRHFQVFTDVTPLEDTDVEELLTDEIFQEEPEEYPYPVEEL